jgi:hypothetical protein
MNNLTVENLHTYYVMAGETPVLVHNDGSGNRPFINSAGQNVDRTLVGSQEDLLEYAQNAAGGSLDNLSELKPGWWQGTRPDGAVVKIEWEPAGHANVNEGPHVTVRMPVDAEVGPKSGWRVTAKVFIKGQETFGGGC